MAYIEFGDLGYRRRRRALARRLLLVGASMLTLCLVVPAKAQTAIAYSDGENRTSPIVMTADTTGSVALEETATQSGAISGGFRFNKAGFGTLILSGANTHSGGTSLNMGTLVLQHQDALGTGSLTMAGNTTLRFGLAGTFVLSNDLEIQGVGVIEGNWRSTGTISGDGRMVVEGNAALGPANTYTGGTDISSGLVSVSGNGSLGTGAVTMGGYTYLLFSPAGAYTIDNAIAFVSGNAYLQTPHAETVVTLNGLLSGNGDFIKTGAGQLVITGANTYRGGTNINGGTIRVGNDLALGTGDVYMQSSSTLQYDDGIVLANTLSPSSGAALRVASGTATQAGAITGSSLGGGFVKTGEGELVLLGNARYGGSTYIMDGTLTGGAQDVLSPSSLHVFNNDNARLRLLADQTVDGISGPGILELNSNRLTIAGTRSDSTFSGQIMGSLDSALIKEGTTTLRLLGDNPTYEGELRLFGGHTRIEGDFSNMDVHAAATLSGTGRLHDVFVGDGVLIGMDGEQLTMNQLHVGSQGTLQVQLGAMSNAALFNVLGDVTLDGRLDVEDVGGFDPGLYRLIDYGGTLTDNGIVFGALPAGYTADDLQLQTAIAGQVNLLRVSEGAQTLFWDGGEPDNWDNGRVDGGSGIWEQGRRSFTTSDGQTNGSQNPVPGFVVFAGNAGDVRVDNESGNAQVTGMQFATDGYRLFGGSIELNDPGAILRVGDGSEAGAAYTAIIDADLVGTGGLIKSDRGRLVLNGTGNTYSGGTEVRAGTLEINGAIGDVVVGADGRLEGVGTVGNATINGTLHAGSTASGPLHIRGDLILSDNALFELEVADDGSAGAVTATGAAALDGRLSILASGNDYADARHYTFLTAEGGITGQFDDVVNNLAFLTATLEYNANDVVLSLARNGNSFAGIAATANQRASATALEGLGVGNDLYDRVLTYDTADARSAFDQLSGEIHASLKSGLLSVSQSAAGTMRNRVVQGVGTLAPLDSAAASGTHVWTSASGSVGVIESDGNAAATRFSAGNLFMGAEADFNRNWLFGAMVGYGRAALSTPDRASSANADSYHAGVYAGGEIGDFTVNGGAALSYYDIDIDRTVALPGFADRLFSSRSALATTLYGELGRKFHLDSGSVFEPFVNLTYTDLYTGGFAERGGAAALRGEAGHAGSTQVTLGLRGQTQFELGEVTATARGMVGWRHAFGERDPKSSQSFSTGSAFTVAASPLPGDTTIIEAGLDFQLSPAVTFGLDYNGQIGSGLAQHGIKASLSARF